MPKELPVVCSLDARDLEQRLAAIGEIGVRSLVLSVAAPEAGQATADGFAMTFTTGNPDSTR
jgi:peroxiredoxin